MNNLKMYVWENVLTDYTDGLVCIMAKDIEQAKEVANEKFEEYEIDSFFHKPFKEITSPDGFLVWGGG